MTKDELSLLLYLESVAVDCSGRITDTRMNEADWKNLKKWTKSGYVASGRIAFESLKLVQRTSTQWVVLSDKAHDDAAVARKARAKRLWADKNYVTTEEKQVETITSYEEDAEE